jgi:hypothetical protein
MELWESSSNDLNIGDLATHGISNWIHDRLGLLYNVSNLKVECQCHEENNGNWHYDSLLVDAGRIEESQDKDTLPTE